MTPDRGDVAILSSRSFYLVALLSSTIKEKPEMNETLAVQNGSEPGMEQSEAVRRAGEELLRVRAKGNS